MPKTFSSPSGRVIIEVADDAMSAMMTILQSGKLIDEKEITDLIDSTGIKYGLLEAVQLMDKQGLQKDFNIPFPIAVCKTGSGPRKLRYHFESTFSNPSELENADPAGLTCVEPDTVLADYSYNVFSGDGSVYNIFGEMIQNSADEAANVMELAGEGVHYDTEHSRFIATCTGYPYLDKKGRICLADNIVLSSGLSNRTFRSPLSIVINGTVENCDIGCGADLIVNGNLTNSKLYCQGSLIVNGNIESCKDAFVHVMGDVSCSGIHGTRLICKGKLSFANDISGCQLICEKGIAGKDSACVLHDGNIQCSGSVMAGFLGNPETNPLEIEITISAYYKNLLMIRTKELIRAKQEENPDPQLVSSLNEEIKALEQSLDEDMTRFLAEDRDEKLCVKADQIIYPGTTIRILKHTYHIKSPVQFGSYTEKD